MLFQRLLHDLRVALKTQQIWEELGSALRHFILRRVGDPHLAEDLLQDVFVRIHSHIEGLHEQERLTAWVFRIARNVVTDHFRGRRNPIETFDEQTTPVPGGDEAELENELGSCAANMVAEPPARYREAFRLVELEGATQAEAAQRLGLSVSGANSRVQRGRTQLKQMLLACCHIGFDRRGMPADWEPRRDCADCDC